MVTCRPWCWVVWFLLVTVVLVVVEVSAAHSTSSSPHQHSSSPQAPTSPLHTNASSPQAYDYYYDYQDNDSDILFYYVEDVPIKNLTYTRILFLCEYLYSAIHGSYEGVTDAAMPYGNSSVTVVNEERFNNVCLPYYRLLRPGWCEEKPFVSACLFDDIVFLHGHGCSRPSPDDAYFELLLAHTLLEEDEACFQAVCSGEVRAVRREVEGHTVHLFSPVALHSVCHKYLMPHYPTQEPAASSVFQNVHWVSCFAGYDVVWSREPGETGGGGGGKIIKTWSYLPPYCRTREQALAAVMAVVVVGGVAGNLVVLMASAWRGHHRDPTGILCVSLATAELLVGVLVLAPGLHAHLQVMNGVAVQHELAAGVSRVVDARMLQVEGGFRVLSAHVLNTGCVVSLLTVLLLALEQCRALAGKSLQEEMTRRRTLGFVAASWSFGVLLSVALVHYGGVFWYAFYKLPLSIAPGVDSGIMLIVAVVILGLVSVATVVLCLVAVWRTFRGGAAGVMHHHATLVRVTAALHVTSAGASGTAFLIPLPVVSSPSLEVTRFLCWWAFLAYTCWHPWLLSLPRCHFQQAVTALTVRWRLLGLHELLCPRPTVSVTPSPPPSPRPPPRPGPKLAPGRRRRFLPGVRYYK